MDRGNFAESIERMCDCDAKLIDIAVQKGIRRAKNDKFAPDKLFRLATLCAATAALCFAMSATPAKAAASRFLLNGGVMTQENADAFYEYSHDLANTIIEYLGGI